MNYFKDYIKYHLNENEDHVKDIINTAIRNAVRFNNKPLMDKIIDQYKEDIDYRTIFNISIDEKNKAVVDFVLKTMFDTDNIIQLVEKFLNSVENDDKITELTSIFLLPYLDELGEKITKKELLVIYKYINKLTHSIFKDNLRNTKVYKKGGDIYRKLERKENQEYHYEDMLEEEASRRESDYWESDPVPHALMEYLKEEGVWEKISPEKEEEFDSKATKIKNLIKEKKKEIMEKANLINDLNNKLLDYKSKLKDMDGSDEMFDKLKKEIFDLENDAIPELEMDIDNLREYHPNNLEDLMETLEELHTDKLEYVHDVYKLHEVEEEGYGIRKFEYGDVDTKNYYDRKRWIVGDDKAIEKLAKDKAKNRVEGEPSLYMNDSNLDTDEIVSDYTESESSIEHEVNGSPEKHLDKDEDRILSEKGRKFYNKYNTIYSSMDSDNQYDSTLYDALYEFDENLDFSEMLALLHDWLGKTTDGELDDLDFEELSEDSIGSDIFELENNEDEMFDWDEDKIEAKVKELYQYGVDEIENNSAEYLRNISAPSDAILRYMDVDSTVDDMIGHSSNYAEFVSSDAETEGFVDDYLIYPYSG